MNPTEGEGFFSEAEERWGGAEPRPSERDAQGDLHAEAEPHAQGPLPLRRLDPRHIDAERLAGWIGVCVVAPLCAVAVGTTWLATDLALPGKALLSLAALVLLGVLAFLATKWPSVSWRHASYRADESGIEIRRGVIWKSVTTVPRTRIQHTDVTQGPIQRRYELATLVLHTAGTENSQVNLGGVTRSTALELRDALVSGPEGGDAV